MLKRVSCKLCLCSCIRSVLCFSPSAGVVWGSCLRKRFWLLLNQGKNPRNGFCLTPTSCRIGGVHWGVSRLSEVDCPNFLVTERWMRDDTQRSPFFTLSHMDLQCSQAVKTHKVWMEAAVLQAQPQAWDGPSWDEGQSWSFCPFLELKILLISCHRKLDVCKLSVASAIWEKSTNIQCLTLDIYSVWPEVLVKIEIVIKYCLQVEHSFHYLEAALLGQKFFKVLFCTLC